MSALLPGASAPLTASVDVAPVAAVANLAPAATAPRRNYFLGIHNFSDWIYTSGAHEGEGTFTSPLITVPVEWNEMIPSWNAVLPPDARLTVEARAIYEASANEAAHTTKYFVMAQWSGVQEKSPRVSVKGQTDADGDVDTDILKLTRRGGQLQLRLTFHAETSAHDLVESLRFMGLVFLDQTAKANEHEPDRAAWGQLVPIPERCQMDYKALGGGVWCSPTSVSMVLEHWAILFDRPELNMTVPHVAAEVLDHDWPGNGNWSFNASYAGSFPGIRGYVARLDGLSELETWIAAGFPVTISVNYALLKGEPFRNSGHLVVCVGFTENGDVIIADPGQHPEPGETYRVFPRPDVVAGWGASCNTVYFIYPESMVPPPNTAHHWDG